MTEGGARVSDRPAAEVRLGRIKAVIWANAGEDGERWHTVQLTRLYRDEAGQWRSTHSVRRDDLLLVAKGGRPWRTRRSASWRRGTRPGKWQPKGSRRRRPEA